MAPKFKILIVDDSAPIRQMLETIIRGAPGLEVVGSAADPYEARDMIKELSPDALTLDVEMPKMNGLSFLKNLMRLRPMPVVMVSTLTEAGSAVTLEALELGAFDYIAKPSECSNIESFGRQLVTKLLSARNANVNRLETQSRGIVAAPSASSKVGTLDDLVSGIDRFPAKLIVALGASTGGTEALREVIAAFPPNFPPVVVVQHIPPGFSRTYAERLDRESRLDVAEATDLEKVPPGMVRIAPGSHHMIVKRGGAVFTARLLETERVNNHRPSVDVLFDSVVEASGNMSVAAILTGMGSDGAKGLLSLRESGAATFAQDEKTSVVYGMPKAAFELGAVKKVLPLDRIARAITERVVAICDRSAVR